MNVAVFGATGKTGRAIIERALALGHTVSALARSPERAALDARVRTVRGDVRSEAAVTEVVAGAQAVLSALGAPLHLTFTQEGRVGSYGMPVIVDAMRKSGVRRLIVTSAYFAGEGQKKLSALGRLLVPTLMHGESTDKNEMERIVRASELDWTIVRPTNLNDKDASDRIREDPPGGVGMKSWISRASVAAFMMRTLSDSKYVHRTVLITD